MMSGDTDKSDLPYILVERFGPQAVLAVLRETRPALAGLVPTMMIDLLDQQSGSWSPRLNEIDDSHLDQTSHYAVM
jgi:hypothetical protein